MEGLGAGLVALAFWGFIASVVVAGIWYGIRERQAQHETLRHMIDSGKPVDKALMDKVLGGDRQVHRDLRIGGLIVLCAAPGMALLGWFISRIAEPADAIARRRHADGVCRDRPACGIAGGRTGNPGRHTITRCLGTNSRPGDRGVAT